MKAKKKVIQRAQEKQEKKRQKEKRKRMLAESKKARLLDKQKQELKALKTTAKYQKKLNGEKMHEKNTEINALKRLHIPRTRL